MAIAYNYSTKTITVSVTVTTLRAVYSDAMSVFAAQAQMDDLIPLRADTPTLYTLINGWVFSAGSIAFLKSSALQDSAGANIWTNIQTLGSISTGTTLYIEQNGAVVYTAPSTGHIDILFKTKDAGTEIDGQAFKVYARKFQQEYSSFATVGGAIVSNVPLATKADNSLDIDQITIDAYTGLTITWGTVTKDAGDGAGAQSYGVVIDGGGKTLKEVYNWVQSELLKATDIDDGAGTKLGNITAPLVAFTGNMITVQGVWVEDFAASDANSIKYVDSAGTTHTPPQSIALSVDADALMTGGRCAIYKLATAYNPATYVPADIVATLLDTTLDANGNASTSMTYTADFPVVVRVRKAGYKPFEVATTLTNAGLSITSINEADTIYQ